MKHFSEVQWSEVARKAIVDKLEVLEVADRIASRSKLTRAQAKIFDKKIKASAAQRFHADHRA